MATRPGRPLIVAGIAAPLELRVSARATRLTLRADSAAGIVRVTVPDRVPLREVERFVDRHRGWIADRAAGFETARPFVDGAVVPYLGVDHRIRHDPEGGRRVLRTGGELRVGGPAEHLARRLHAYLRTEARHALHARVRHHAERLEVTVAGVTVRDTTSRWGSCSADGRLSFSWRLILAPDWVLDYVVAHEIAHRREMNHSRRFWRLVEALHPTVPEARAWLRREGARLHRYGAEADGLADAA